MAAIRRRLRHGFLMIALSLLALSRESSAQLHVEGDPGPLDQITILQLPDQAFDEVVVTVALRLDETVIESSPEITGFDSSIITGTNIEALEEVEPGLQHTNFTLTFEFDGLVGETLYSFELTTSRNNRFKIEGSYRVAGVSLQDSAGNLVSNEGSFLSTGNFEDNLQGPEVISVKVVPFLATEDVSVALRDATVQFEPPTAQGVYQEEVMYNADCNLVNIGPSGDLPEGCGIGFNEAGTEMKIQISPYRVGYGEFRVLLQYPGIVDADDPSTPFSHTVVVMISNEPPAPPVFISETIFADYYGGEEHTLVGFNLAFPAQEESISSGEMAISGSNDLWDINITRTSAGIADESPDILVYFSSRPQPSEAKNYEGQVSVGFASSVAETSGQSIAADTGSAQSIVVEYRSDDLASTVVGELPADVSENVSKIILNVDITMAQYDTMSYSVNKFEQTCSHLLGIVGSSDQTDCALVRLGEPDDFAETRNGPTSARQVNTDGLVALYQVAAPVDTWEEEAEKIEDSVVNGDMAQSILVNPSTLALLNDRRPAPATPSPTPSSSPAPRESTASLAPWAVGLIAVLTAIALVALVGCCLFALYKRDDDDETESTFSADAGAVIPRPDDATYQQAIVRDAFGRGEADEASFQEGAETDDGVPAEYPQLNS